MGPHFGGPEMYDMGYGGYGAYGGYDEYGGGMEE